MDSVVDGQSSDSLRAVVGELGCYLTDIAVDLFGKLTDADVLAELREFEALRRRLAVVVDHVLVAELGRRALAGRLAMSSTPALLQAALRLSPHEAKQRVTAAGVGEPRWSLTGEQLETLLPEVVPARRPACSPWSRPG